jgi:predicted nuclease of predicted toxin-antitoxin system
VKIKLDENLPERLVPALSAFGHDIDTVRGERLNGQTDPSVWSATQAARRFFITQDLDFSDIRRYTPGTHAGLLLLRLARPGRDALFERVLTVFQTENVGDWTGCLVVVTDRKVRVRRRPTEP